MTRRVRRNSWPRLLAFLAVLMLVGVRLWQERESFEPPASQNLRRADGTLQAGQYRVLRVIDGDTLLLVDVVRLEVYASLDPIEDELHDDRDHLQEIQEILDRLDDTQDDQICDDVYHHQRFDLCSECRKRYVSNPLARPTTHHLDFSQN